MQVQQALLSDRSSPENWRFFHQLFEDISENNSLEWFSVKILPYGNPSELVATMHVMGTPAQVLAEFVRELPELAEGITFMQPEILDIDITDRYTVAIAIGISKLRCKVATRIAQDTELFCDYEDRFLRLIPTRGIIRDMWGNNDVPLVCDEMEMRSKSLKTITALSTWSSHLVWEKGS